MKFIIIIITILFQIIIVIINAYSSGTFLIILFKEVSSQGQAVGTTGKVKHSFNSFASQDFQFSDISSGTLQSLSVEYFTFTCQLKGLPSTLKVYVSVPNSDIYIIHMCIY